MKVVLSIAGSDSSGGAGIQADIKSLEAHGVFAATAVTALTAQNTGGVRDVLSASPEFVVSQIRAVMDDFEVSAIKIGALLTKKIIDAVDAALKGYSGHIVLDPVCSSKAGSPLLEEGAEGALLELCKRATVVTPNMTEAKKLYGYEIGESSSLCFVQEAGYPILVKNHVVDRGEDAALSVDILYDGRTKSIFETPVSNPNFTHGAGCSFSSAIAANLALGYPLLEAIRRAKWFVYFAIEEASKAAPIGGGKHPLAHKAGYEAFERYIKDGQKCE